jgi:DNA polymerase-3 subunit epsilon
MDKKILWIDTETSGLDPKKNDPLIISGIVEINGEVYSEFTVKSAPIEWDSVSRKALKVNGITLEELAEFPKPDRALELFKKKLGDYVNKFNKEDKFYIGGYNVRFDLNFMSEWFKKQDDKYFGSWFNWKMVDVMSLLHTLDFRGVFTFKNYKLKTITESLGIGHSAHKAESDIAVTREIYHVLLKYFK